MDRVPPPPVRTAVLRRPARSERPRLVAAAAVLATLGTVAVLALAPWAAARPSLPELLPPDVVLAVGAYDLASEAPRFDPFLEEAARLELVERLSALVPADLLAGNDLDADVDDLPDDVRDLGALEFVGREAWLVLSASRLRPLPALTAVARVAPDAEAALAAWIDRAAERPGTERRSEGDAAFYARSPAAGDAGSEVPVAFARAGDLFVASSDPEMVRAILRANAGGGDPVWADSDAYRALDALGEGHLFTVFDPEPLLATFAPLASASGAGPALQRARAALRSVGPSVARLRVEADGVATASVRAPDRSGPDPTLARLLTEARAADPATLAFAPEGALAVTSTGHDLDGWWAWLDDVLGAGADLGLPDASEAAQLFGLDPKRTVLSWAGDRSVSIVTGPPAAATPGVASGSLLGEQALLVATDAPDRARAGLNEAFTNLGALLGGFLAPSGMGAARPETVQVEGVDVLRLALTEALIVDAAVLEEWVLLTGSPAATAAVLRARASGGPGPDALVAAAARLPSDPVSWTVSDEGASLAGTTDAAIAQLQLLAGLGGATTLDFDAVDAASASLRAWFAFVADRLGVRVAHTVLDDGRLLREEFLEVSW